MIFKFSFLGRTRNTDVIGVREAVATGHQPTLKWRTKKLPNTPQDEERSADTAEEDPPVEGLESKTERTYKYSHTFKQQLRNWEPEEDKSAYADIVPKLIEDILRNSRAGREFAESSISIQNATKLKAQVTSS